MVFITQNTSQPHASYQFRGVFMPHTFSYLHPSFMTSEASDRFSFYGLLPFEFDNTVKPVK
jgi:hypothetical protein